MANTRKPTREDILKLADYKRDWAAAEGNEMKQRELSSAADALRAETGMSQGGVSAEGVNKGLAYGTYTEQQLRDLAAGMGEGAANNTQGPVGGDYNINAISNIYSNMLNSQKAQIESARQSAVSGYEEQMEGVAPEYAQRRSDVDVQTARNIQAQNEMAAAKGTTFSGGVQSDVGATRASGLQQKTALTRDEANLVASIKRAIADTNKAASLQQVSAAADIQSQEAMALMNERNRQQEFDYRAGRDKVSDAQWQQSFDRQGEQWQKTFDQSQQQWDQTFQYQKDQDAIKNGQWLKSFNLSKAKNAADAKYKADMLAWSKSPNNPDNVLKTLEDTGASEAYVEAYSSILDWLGEMSYSYDQWGYKTGESAKYNESQIVAMLEGFPNLTADEKLELHNMAKGVLN